MVEEPQPMTRLTTLKPGLYEKRQRADQKRIAEQPWRRWYRQKPWRSRREQQLRAKPLCEWCEKRGRITPATEVHHDQPHRGDWNKFIKGALVSLCALCHNREAQRIETTGYSNEIGIDGYPIDPRHPFHQGE